MTLKSINPYTGEQIASYKKHTEKELNEILDQSAEAYNKWKKVSIEERAKLMLKAAELLEKNESKYAKTITLEMGKPLSESIAEIQKCAWVCKYYAENAAEFLQSKTIETDAYKSYVRYDPQGTVFAIMPWNFPFWQVLRFAAPTLMAGNTALLKHASNVFGSATHIAELFVEAGFPKGVFQNLLIDHDQTEMVVKHRAVSAITLTGSEKAGSAVAALAGKYLKRSLLELGGSNAFIVAEDADIDKAIEIGLMARMRNNGQSCIAAKRFILVGNTYERFMPKFKEAVSKLKIGDPLEEGTQISVLAREDLAEDLEKQVKKSVEMGAEILIGGERKGAHYEPTILVNVQPGMPAFDEETFGPMAAIIQAATIDEAFELAAKSKFGLGLTLFSEDIEKAQSYADRVEDGAFFINELVKSDPRLPFGGTKISGYGRELSREGLLEFVNVKTVFVNK
ncbi:NAD-dependent succinate-semialdehyde dehydrogenase [Fulvivirgaceae bacterium LMO-SS25]